VNSIIEELRKKRDYFSERGASEETIRNAERTLDLSFADEYREYLQRCGSASCAGHELTGISADKSLDVVRVTKHHLDNNPNVTIPLYVVEEAHVDGIVIWQSPTGEIYQTEYKDSPHKIYSSLSEYVLTFQ
jgi:hypothetical protein